MEDGLERKGFLIGKLSWQDEPQGYLLTAVGLSEEERPTVEYSSGKDLFVTLETFWGYGSFREVANHFLDELKKRAPEFYDRFKADLERRR